MSHAEQANKNLITRPSEMLGKQLDFYVLRTTLDITPGAANTESQQRLNALIQMISLRATPCIVNVEPSFKETNPGDLTVTEPTDVFVLRFAIDAVGAWEGAVPSLPTMIAELGHGFQEGNFSVTYQSSM